MILALLLQGAKLWEYQFEGRPSTGTPAVEFGRVFMTDESGHITALDAADGRKLWGMRHGCAAPRTPVVVGGRVYFAAGKPGKVFCLRASDGARLWEVELPADGISPAAVIGDRVVVSHAGGAALCLKSTDGARLWEFPLGKKAGGMAAAEGGRLFVPGGEDERLHCLDLAKGRELWSWAGKGAVSARPAVAGGRVFVPSADGTLACLDAATGRALWSRDIEVASWPTAADGRLYFGRGDASAVALDAADGKQLWEIKCGNEVYSSPTAAGGKLYFGSFDKKFYALDAATGKPGWTFEAPTPLSGSAAVVGGRLYFADRGRALYCLDADDAAADGWPMAGGPLPGPVEIRAKAGPSDIAIRATPRMAGAIDSLVWNGKEFIDRADHGRCLQSAVNFDPNPETLNPTEAGSMFDGDGERSTSIPLRAWADGNRLETRTRAAYWLRPGESSGGRPALNTTPLSDCIISKRVTIGAGGLIQFEVTFSGPPQRHAQYEVLTGYMPPEFSRFLAYDPAAKAAVPLSDGPGEQPLPVILSTPSGSHAMGIHSSDAPSYGRWRFKDVVKWNCVSRAAKEPVFRCTVIVGTLDEVTAALRALHPA